MDCEKLAEILWERLVEAFNAEAATYDPEKYNSQLGSIGPVEDREVCRSQWWEALGGEELIGQNPTHDRQLLINGKSEEGFDYYWEITHLIESEHYGEELATGKITFGS